LVTRGRHRPLGRQRFLVELDLLTAGDLEAGPLARMLLGLATAGLHGLVVGVVRMELNGCAYALEGPKGAMSLHPPPDERVSEALRDLERVIRNLSAIPRAAVA
jgi:hypothetical protein